MQLQPGDTLFVYTDGVPEATDAENNMRGADTRSKRNYDPATCRKETTNTVSLTK